MKRIRWVLGACVAVMGIMTLGTGQAAGLLHPRGDADAALDLKAHMVDVVVEDGYVVTHIEQIFANPSTTDLEAIYSFPVPENAAVSDFTHWIDGKPVSGEVVEKKRARAIYESERDAGREAAVTEQDDYRTFDISVTPVRAQDDVRIRLSYIQPAHVDLGVGRYVYPLEEGGVDEAKLSFWGTETEVRGYFRFGMWVRTAVPLAAVRLPAHPNAGVTKEADGSYRVLIESGSPPAARALPVRTDGHIVEAGLSGAAAEAGSGQFGTLVTEPSGQANGSAFSLDQDIVVYWRLRDGLPGSVDVVANRADSAKPGTFMLTLTPGDELRPLEETGADWVFVVDVSGSMDGKIHSVREGLHQALDAMRPMDRAQIVTFNESAHTLTSGFVNGSPDNIRRLKKLAASIRPGGSTDLFEGLERGLDLADADRSTAIILITDGVANTGEVEHNEFVELIERKDTRLFTFVMGNSANRPLLSSMTEVSGGEAFNVSNNDDIIGHVKTAIGKLHHEALRDISVSIDGVGARALSPLRLGTLHAGEQLTVFGRYQKAGIARLTVTGTINGRAQTYETGVRFPDIANENPEIDRLWYFSRIEELMEQILRFGEDGERVGSLVDLAVDGGLVTPYTSMLVVRAETFAAEGIDRRNAARVANEHAAQQTRATRPVQTRSAQATSPNTGQHANPQPFQGQRSGHSGGGGGNIGLIGLILAWFTARVFRRRATA